MTTDPEWLRYLERGKNNKNAHIESWVLEEIRNRVQRLEREKTHLYHEIKQHTLRGADSDSFRFRGLYCKR